ncbi:MAG TPA: hypothetical protein VM580_19870 [Labilithrix sp.]|jgi:hypothetical protein|nr:hypothetical protein [Labilithrix sp.]
MSSSFLPRIAKLAYVAGMLTLASVGTLNALAKVIADYPLNGVEATAKEPAISFKALWNEQFQKEATAWFEQHWGLRGYAARTDNTIVFRLFGESRAGGNSVSRDGVLIHAEDLTYVNRSDDSKGVIAFGELLARVQQKMRRQGQVLVPVIIPAKTSFYRRHVPSKWQRRGSYELSDTNLYGAFVATLNKAGVVFVDSRALLSDPPKRPEEIFAPTGRHWRISGACRVLQAVLDAARPELPELGSDQLDCRTRIAETVDIEAEDLDLFRLLNVWGNPPASVAVEVLDAKAPAGAVKLPTLFVGSSFVWAWTRVSSQLRVLQPSLFYYYDSSVVDTTTLLITKKVEPFTDGWREDTFGKRLVVLGILESYLPEDGAKFLNEVDKAIE